MIRRLFRYLFNRRQADADLQEELKTHIAIERQRRIDAGESPEAAQTAALRDFGNVAMVTEVTREMWGWAWLENFWQDLQHGVRLLPLSPGFTLVAVLSLALGIGANTAIFQLIDAVLLRSLPIDRPQDLIEVRIAGGNGGMGLNPGRYTELTRPMWEELRRQQKAFTGLMAWRQNEFRVGTGSERRRARGLEVSGDYFSILGISPWRGRMFSMEDEAFACPSNRLVVSHSWWQSEMGSRELGTDSKIMVNDQLFEVVGVTPPDFHGVAVGESFDLAIPMCRPATAPRRDIFANTVMGRMLPGWTIPRATAHLESLSAGIMEATEIQGYGKQTTERYRGFRLMAVSGANGVSGLRQDYDASLWLLLAMTGLILLIACANLANLTLARSTSREREIAVRLSIGASRGRLLRQFTAESAVLAGFGALLGVGVAQVLSRMLVAALSTKSNSIYLPLGLDWRVLLFAALLASVTCIVFGTLPALRVLRMQPQAVMRGAGRGMTAGRERYAMQRVMVIAQIAISLVLLTGALLFVQSFRNLMTFDPGLRQRGISIARLGMPNGFPVDRVEGLQRDLLEEVRATPGVRSVGSTTTAPLLGSSWSHGATVGARKGSVKFTWVSPGYFETMGMPLAAGRSFDDRDSSTSKRVAVVNQSFVRQFCPEVNPIGQVLRTDAEPGFPSTLYEVVGVVPDTRYSGLRDDVYPAVFAPALQYPRLGPWASLMIHSDVSHAATVAAVKARLAQRFPVMMMEFDDFRGRIEDGLVRERIMATLSGFLGGLAAVLATIGLYGVVSYFVARRRNEIGIRVALGARRGGVVGMIMMDAARFLVPGIAIGVALSLLATRGATALLFEVKPNDPLTLTAAAALLTGIALAASLIPALRASSIDPLVALRHE